MILNMLKTGSAAAATAVMFLATEVMAFDPHGLPHPAAFNETAGAALAGEISAEVVLGGLTLTALGLGLYGLFKKCCPSQATSTAATAAAVPMNYGTQV